jgi:hypothetical protein
MSIEQCCGSGMFIPYPRSEFFPIPNPGIKRFRIHIEEFKYYFAHIRMAFSLMAEAQ